jgi:threonyl-tRNA synthetase
MKYMRKVLNLLENHEIRALVDNRNETIGRKLEMPKCKTPFMLIVGEEEEKMGLFHTSSWTRRKRKYHRNNRRICNYCKRRDQQNIKSIYSLT